MAGMTDLAAPSPDLAAAARSLRLSLARTSVGNLAIPGLAALAAVLYLLNLTVSGYANTYYAMAAQAASQSWSALFFGALDGQGFITIDKPPLATALMGLSVKAFGLSSWSVLAPQAMLGVATVVVLYLAVRRSFGTPAAVLAGLIMAVTPVAVLIFRYDNPDALLTFLLVSAAWAVGRGLEDGRLRWALLAATLIGAGFLTKYLQAWLVLPGFALVWLACSPGSFRRRIGGLLSAGGAVALSSGWWVAIVELLPAGSRPYVGGSETNSAVELLLGYDGLGRLFGNEAPGSSLGSATDGLAFGGPGSGGGTFGGLPGLFRMLNDQFGGQIAWLLPAAILSIAAAVVIHRRSTRTDRRVAGYALWAGWLLVHLAVFSFMSGIIHPYYTVILAPAIAALVGAAATELWARRRTSRLAGPGLAAGVVVTGLTAWALLERTPTFLPGLGLGVLALAVAAAILIAIPDALASPAITRAAIAIALVAALAGPLAFAADTMATAYGGGDPGAGPQAEYAGGGPGVGGGPPGNGRGSTSNQALIDYLVANAGSARWIVAANGSQSAAVLQLEAGLPVMTMGGFSGGDPTPTLAELRAYVASGAVRFVLVDTGGRGGPGGPAGSNSVSGARSAWVTSACTPVTVDGVTAALYDCAGAA
jgi:4-amino-4-deoxy-L-arabinose transferase-like glycosyltransferase